MGSRAKRELLRALTKALGPERQYSEEEVQAEALKGARKAEKRARWVARAQAAGEDWEGMSAKERNGAARSPRTIEGLAEPRSFAAVFPDLSSAGRN